MNQRRWNTGAGAFGFLTIAVLLVGLFWPASSSKEAGAKPTSTTTTVAVTTTTVPTSSCPNSWKKQESNKRGNRWVADGITSIRDAKTPAEARKGLGDWVSAVKRDPVLLAGASHILLKKDVSTSSLFDKQGCATASAVALVEELQETFVTSKVEPGTAPSGATNSGATNRTVVIDLTPGMAGDLRAIHLTLPDGTEVWILWRCGNIAMKNPPPGLPKGPTDNPKPSCPPGQTYGGPGIGCTSGKHASESPVVSNPNSTCEACRPNTSEPARAPAPTTTVPSGTISSGSGAVNTVPPPTTVAPAPAPPTTASPAPPSSGCVDPQGIGIC